MIRNQWYDAKEEVWYDKESMYAKEEVWYDKESMDAKERKCDMIRNQNGWINGCKGGSVIW